MKRVRVAGAAIAAILGLGSPFWGPLLMRRMAYFRVRRIEIIGARYVAPGDILARLHVDTTASVWDPTAPLVARLGTSPEIANAVVSRKLPGTLVVQITERIPVALVPGLGGFRVYDDRGALLPIDPARVSVDAPVLAQRDTSLLRLLGAMRAKMPALYARVSAARSAGADDVILDLDAERVRAMRGVTLDRLGDIAPVEEDLARKHLRVSELDLRYRDQVIARLP
ncbi:MAG TPA: FtsQ-type POTRA domain-containing protein [Gemmatimonadaceae bacterium]|jgi:cell division protein FtsQ|nr:FtsQ-type POTRA domain-containing protein [Gemmatimonadaceae bacterium]